MASPISLGDALTAVQTVYSVYKAIKEAPAKVDDVGKSVAGLKSYLVSLQSLINDKTPLGLAAKRPDLVSNIRTIASDVTSDMTLTQELLQKFKSQMAFGVEWKLKWVANAIFTAKDMGKLEDLNILIKGRILEIDQQINLLNSFGINAIIVGQQSQQLGAQHGKKHHHSPLPSPSPQPPQNININIIFIDPKNEARSVVAQAYVELLKNLTMRAGDPWRIDQAHSAGLRVRSRCNVKNFLEPVLGYMTDGNRRPNQAALSALYENPSFSKELFTKEVKQQIDTQRSRGITSGLFARYDIIFVFERHHVKHLETTRKAFQDNFGSAATRKGKGRVMLLGLYGDELRDQTDITDGNDPNKMSPEEYRKRWDKIVFQIANAIKSWMGQELEWKKPGG